jgi:hypothetical protein
MVVRRSPLPLLMRSGYHPFNFVEDNCSATTWEIVRFVPVIGSFIHVFPQGSFINLMGYKSYSEETEGPGSEYHPRRFLQ